jgi:ribosome-associated protein
VNTVLQIIPSVEIPLSELRFRTSRSSGPGGQNVNKLETRVELMFDVIKSPSLSDDRRTRILATLGTRVDAKGTLHLSSQKSRSQWENKQLVIERFVSVLRSALRIGKKRIKTSPSVGSKERRVQAKKRHGQKKKMRKVNHDDE